MIGSSDGQQYENALDLRLGKPVEEAENVPLPKPRKPRPDDPGPADNPAVPETGRFGKYIWAQNDSGFQNPNIPHITVGQQPEYDKVDKEFPETKLQSGNFSWDPKDDVSQGIVKGAAPVSGFTEPYPKTAEDIEKLLDENGSIRIHDQSPAVKEWLKTADPDKYERFDLNEFGGKYDKNFSGETTVIRKRSAYTSENEPEINRDHNVKSGSVASKDSDTVYIDPSIPDKFAPFLATHETVEKDLMAKGMKYPQAHIQATLAERQKVEEDGNMSWKTYTDEIDPYVAKAEKGDGKNPPPDPHVNIEDSIGHHADKAKTLEKADYKIASDADERPQAGQKYAMEDRVRRTPEDLQGPGRPTEGGVSKMKLKEVPMDETAKEFSPSSRLFDLHVEGKTVGNMTLTPRTIDGKQLIHIDYVRGFKPGATVTERAQAAVEFKKELQKEFPEAVGVYGMRISGAKAGSSDPYQYVPLKDEYSGKMLKELAGRYSPPALRPNPITAGRSSPRSDDATERALQSIYEALRAERVPDYIRPPSGRTPMGDVYPSDFPPNQGEVTRGILQRLEALEAAQAPRTSTMGAIGGAIKEGAKGAGAAAIPAVLLDPTLMGGKTESDEEEAQRRGGDLDVRRK